MTGGFQYDVEGIRSHAPDFDAAAHDLAAAGAALRSARNGAGACWGDDAAGQEFAAKYRPAADDVDYFFTALSGLLQRIRVDLDASADSTQGTDETGAAAFGGGAS